MFYRKRFKRLNRKLNEVLYKIDSLLQISFPNGGERQVETRIENIRADHRARYSKASDYIKSNDEVLDIACGVGYGSYMMSVKHSSSNFTGVDISQKTIEFANNHYKRKNINFVCENCLNIKLKNKFYDVITTFETVEHIDEDKLFLKKLFSSLKDDGTLILSTPNEDIMPFSKENFYYHVRHYRQNELEDLLKSCGFKIKEVFAQPDNQTDEIISGWQGKFNIVIAEKIK
ncbi:MAG: class I SAM-dependent methyltransferase [Alphaproteobacteria bacterium]|nr:class I SAM-dependent methyltransferase [Alphaproteobacteria bacterium]